MAKDYKMTTPIAPGVATPDKLETSIGTLHLSDGFPKPDTVEKIYDNLDRSRALQAYLLAIPIVNQAGMRDSLRQFGPDNQTDVIWENLVDPKTVELTANDNTIYNFIWIDTHKGPVVVEIPPMSLGAIDDFWYRWVADVGITGADQGKGGKYLILPPGYTGEVPRRLLRRAPEHLRQLGALPDLSRGWLAQARRRVGQEAPEDLSAGRCGQSRPCEVRQCLGHPGQLRRTWRLLVLGAAQQGHPGGAERRAPTRPRWVSLPRSASRRASRSIRTSG